MTSQRVCVCAPVIFLLPWARGCPTWYSLKSLNLSPVGALPSSPHSVSYLLVSPAFWYTLLASTRECNLLSTGIDLVHKVLISTLGWITGASLHDCTGPFRCLVPPLAREHFTSLESVIGYTPHPAGLLPLSSTQKDPRVWFLHSLDWVFLCWFCHMKAR